ncbi:hypothetical protein RB201_09715 [Streptomyces sp. S1A(2023)]
MEVQGPLGHPGSLRDVAQARTAEARGVEGFRRTLQDRLAGDLCSLLPCSRHCLLLSAAMRMVVFHPSGDHRDYH